MYALADADEQNPALEFFDCLGNPIQDSDTSNDKNEDNAGGLTGVEEFDNQEIPGVYNQSEIPGVEEPFQEEIPGVATPGEEEEIPDVDIT